MERHTRIMLCSEANYTRIMLILIAFQMIKLLYSLDPMLMQERRKGGEMPAHRAAYRGHTDIVKFLYEKNVSLLSEVNDAGETVAHCAALGQQVCRACVRIHWGRTDFMDFHEKYASLLSKWIMLG